MPPDASLFSGVWGMSCIRTERAQTDWAKSWLTFDLSSDTSVYMENIMTIKKGCMGYKNDITPKLNTRIIQTDVRISISIRAWTFMWQLEYFRDHFQEKRDLLQRVGQSVFGTFLLSKNFHSMRNVCQKYTNDDWWVLKLDLRPLYMEHIEKIDRKKRTLEIRYI